MADVPENQESSVEDRLANYFSPQKSAPTGPEAEQPQEQEAVSQDAGAETPVEEGDDTQVSEEAPEGFVELEHLGRKYHVPPDLKEAFESTRSMATKVTQEVASVRRALEVEKLAMNAAKVAEGEVKGLTDELTKLASYKEQAKKLDWSTLTLDQKVDLDRELRSIDERMSSLGQQISAKRGQAQQLFGEFVLASVQNTEQFMAQKVPGWDTQKGQTLHAYGEWTGIPKEKLITGWFADPTATEIMWKAMQWDSLQYSKPGVQNKAKNAPPVIRPASNQVQKSAAQSNFQKDRERLKKSGSLEDAARLFMRMK